MMESLKGTPVLTISDEKGFCARGGMIELFHDENKLRFNVNLREAVAARIKISSKLLSLARHVTE